MTPAAEGEGAAPARKPRAMGGDSFARFLGLEHDGPGVTRLQVTPKLLNGTGLLLGPVGFALVDFAMGSALWAQRNPGESIATINIAINYIQGARAGEIVCRATLDRRNRHIAVLTASVHDEQGQLLITSVGSFSIFMAKQR